MWKHLKTTIFQNDGLNRFDVYRLVNSPNYKKQYFS